MVEGGSFWNRSDGGRSPPWWSGNEKPKRKDSENELSYSKSEEADLISS